MNTLELLLVGFNQVSQEWTSVQHLLSLWLPLPTQVSRLLQHHFGFRVGSGLPEGLLGVCSTLILRDLLLLCLRGLFLYARALAATVDSYLLLDSCQQDGRGRGRAYLTSSGQPQTKQTLCLQVTGVRSSQLPSSFFQGFLIIWAQSVLLPLPLGYKSFVFSPSLFPSLSESPPTH